MKTYLRIPSARGHWSHKALTLDLYLWPWAIGVSSERDGDCESCYLHLGPLRVGFSWDAFGGE